MRAISDDPIPRPSGPRPIAPRLERIVMTALERAPEDRFADAREMALLLERNAFRTDGFDPAALVTQLKQLFPSDHAGWKATVGMAQVVEAVGHRKITSAFPLLGDASTRTGGPTLALHKKRRSEATTRPEIALTFPAELSSPDLEIDDGHPALPRLTGWGDAQPEPGSEGGELSSGIGDDAAAYAALRRWASKRARLPRPMWLLVGAIAAAGVFAGLRWTAHRASEPVTPLTIVDVREEATAPGSRPVVEALQSVAVSPSPAAAPETTQAGPVTAPPEPAALALIGPPAPTATPAPQSPATPPAAAKPALRRSPPVPVRVVKKPVRKQAIAHRPPAAAKPAPTRQSTVRSEPRPTQAPLVRPGWRDPFSQ